MDSIWCSGGGKGGDPEAPPPAVEVLERVDTAQLAGLMPEPPNARPAWFTAELAEELTDTMVRRGKHIRLLLRSSAPVHNAGMASGCAPTCRMPRRVDCVLAT